MPVCTLQDLVPGTIEQTFRFQTEVDELVRHRTELQDTLTRVRAELAAEKTKETRKSRSEVAANPQEGTSISKVASGPVTTVRPAIKKFFPALDSRLVNDILVGPLTWCLTCVNIIAIAKLLFYQFYLYENYY